MSAPTATRRQFVYASSLAIDVATMKRVPEADTIANETRVVLRRIEQRLRNAGLTLRDIAKTTCFVRDESQRMEFIEAYREVFAPGPYPARCTLVLGLAGDCRVQVEAVAATDGFTVLESEELGDRYGLSAGAVIGDYAFAAGLALDPDTLRPLDEAGTVADEVRICLQQVAETLGRAGCALRDVVKTTCWISDESHRGEFIEAYREAFAPGPYPARATLVAGIAGGCRVEIDAVAMRSDAGA